VEKTIAFDILRAIRRILRRVAEHSRAISREGGLTLPQLLALKALGEREGDDVTLGTLSDAINLSAATTSGIVDRLVRADLVRRERGEIDRRRVRLSLTDSGRERLDRLPTPLQDRFLARLAQLSPDQADELRRALELIVTMMDAEELGASPILAADEDLSDGL
jgi:DNA-binding MarR family transcriptional regulator